MIRPPKPLLIILTGFLFSLAWFHGAFSASQVPPFSDLPSNPLYYPAIELFREQNIIVGDTVGGQPIGQLRPSDLLQRDEFTKVAVVVRLLEEGNTQLLSLELDPFTLALSTLLKSYYKVTAGNGAVPFKDIQEKPDNCAAEPSGCSPWHTEFINFASSRGMIRGYAQDGTFRPVNPILRIHALKLTIASNGNLPADQDPKVIRITNDPRLEGRKVRCLVGTEQYILANNGGNTQDSQNLLAYAMQADRLDIFGNRCQAFTEVGANTPKQRADYLQKPLRRQEIARYFALTTTIPQLQLDPSTDPTVDTRSEYITPVSQELTEEEDPMEKLSKKGKLGSESNDPKNRPAEAVTDDHEIIRLNRPLADMMVSELIAIHKQGRCCLDTTIFSCKPIEYDDYLITEEPELGAFTDGTALWHKAKRGNEVCFVPYADIVGSNQEYQPSIEVSVVKTVSTPKTTSKKVKKVSYPSTDCGVIMSCEPIITYETVYESIYDTGECGVNMSCEPEIFDLAKPKKLEQIASAVCNTELMSCENKGSANTTEKKEPGFFEKGWTGLKEKTVSIVDGPLEVTKNAAIKTARFTKHSLFLVSHPKIALEIGLPNEENGENISSVVTNFAVRNSLQENAKAEGSQTNAFRHVLWQAEITKKFGEEIAVKAADAHELFPPKIDNDKIKSTEFAELLDADKAADVRNNIIGREIGLANQNFSTKELALLTIQHFREKGLWTAEKQPNGNYKIILELLTEEEYEKAVESIVRLNEKGKPHNNTNHE